MSAGELTQEQALDLMEQLDRGTSIFGKLSPDVRARLYAVAENPTEATWNDAHGIMITNETMTTMWQALNKHSGFKTEWVPDHPTTLDEIFDQRPLHNPRWPVIPTREQILTALREELRPGHQHEDWQIRDSDNAKGGRYCAACGQPIPNSPDTPTAETFVVIGQQYWGKGATVPEAKKNFREQGGRLTGGYVLLTFDAETEFIGVDAVGYLHYKRRDDKTELPNPPKQKEVKPRRQH